MGKKTNKRIKAFKGAACGLALALITGPAFFAPSAEGASLAGEAGRAYAEARPAGEPGEKVPAWLAGPSGGSQGAAKQVKAIPSLYLEEIGAGPGRIIWRPEKRWRRPGTASGRKSRSGGRWTRRSETAM